MPTKKQKSTDAPQEPIRIIVEVIVRTESTPSITPSVRMLRDDIQADVTNNFDYSFDLTDLKVLRMTVERYEKDFPPSSGSFFSIIPDPNPVKHIHVVVVATEVNPGGNGTMTLKFNGKDVFTPAQPFVIAGGVAGINQTPALP